MNTADLTFAPLVPELVCADFERSLAFYRDILGFERAYGRENPSFAYLVRERAQLMLEQLDEDSWRVGAMDPPFGRGINLQIETADLAPLLKSLEAARWPLYRAPEDAWYRAADRLHGQRQFLVQDPDGYLLRFCQDLGDRPLDAETPGARRVP